MVRTHTLVGLVALTLLLATGTGAAQSLGGTGATEASVDHTNELQQEQHLDAEAYMGGDAEADLGTDVVGTDEVCPPEHMCTPAEQSDDEAGAASAEGEFDVEATLDIDLSDLAELKLPEGGDDAPDEPDEEPIPTADEPSEEPADEPEENVSTDERGEDHAEGIVGGNGSITGEAYAYADGDANTSPGDPDEEPAPATEDEKPAPENKADDEANLTEELPVAIAAEDKLELQDIGSYLELREQDHVQVVFTPTERPAPPAEEDEPEREPAPTPVENELDLGEETGISFDVRGAFEASTRGATTAFTAITGAIEELVGQLKGTGAGAVETSSAVESSTDVKIVKDVTGTAGIASGVTGAADAKLVDEVAMPKVQPPTVDMRGDAAAHSETSVSSDLTGDLGFGL